jgi:hypothetical protein
LRATPALREYPKSRLGVKSEVMNQSLNAISPASPPASTPYAARSAVAGFC